MNYCSEFVPPTDNEISLLFFIYSTIIVQNWLGIFIFFFSHTVHTLLKVNAQQV